MNKENDDADGDDDGDNGDDDVHLLWLGQHAVEVEEPNIFIDTDSINPIC